MVQLIKTTGRFIRSLQYLSFCMGDNSGPVRNFSISSGASDEEHDHFAWTDFACKRRGHVAFIDDHADPHEGDLYLAYVLGVPGDPGG